jgi:hypothetical protein
MSETQRCKRSHSAEILEIVIQSEGRKLVEHLGNSDDSPERRHLRHIDHDKGCFLMDRCRSIVPSIRLFSSYLNLYYVTRFVDMSCETENSVVYSHSCSFEPLINHCYF